MRDWVDKVNQLIDEVLKPQEWGFFQTYRSDGRIIYNSKWCRILFYNPGSEPWHTKPCAMTSYGRLHAPNEGSILIVNGEKCWAWGGSWHTALPFLEGIPPHKAVRHLKLDVVEPYRTKIREAQDGTAKEIIYMERAIWEHYGTRLFELFDLRRPELWEQYRSWLKAYYIAEGRKEEEDERRGLIPSYRVC